MLSSIQQRRIVRVVEAHRSRLGDARQDRNAAIEQFAGSRYAGRDEMDREPLAMVELATVVFTHLLASNRPKYAMHTQDWQLLVDAISLELSLNKTMKRMRVEKVYQALVQSAMFGLAVAWVGLTESDTNFYNMIGRPMVANIDFDDLVYDTNARCWEECQFIGHRYQLPYEEVMESDLFDPAAKRRLHRLDEEHSFDSYGEERLQRLGSGSARSADMLEDVVELWNIWCPRSQTVVTLPADGQDLILRQVEWTGPRHGPYHRLSFNDVPNNILPSAPINVILDLHELVNLLYVHSARQALRQKNVMVFPQGAEGDAKKWIEAKDGDAISSQQKGEMVSGGGADFKTVGMIADAMNKYRYFLGNLDSIAGLAPVADTATAEGQILQQASARLNWMRMRVNEVVQAVGEDVLHYLMSDPFMTQRLSRPIPGMDAYATYPFRPSAAAIDLDEIDLQVDPYSMQPKNPQQKLNSIMKIVTGIAIPFGAVPSNVAALIKRASQLEDVEAEIDNLFMPGPGQLPQQTQQGASDPNKPNGKYDMVHRSTNTQRGRDANLATMMMGQANGQGMQQSEMAAAME